MATINLTNSLNPEWSSKLFFDANGDGWNELPGAVVDPTKLTQGSSAIEVRAPGASGYDLIYIEYNRSGDSVTLNTVVYAFETGPNSRQTVMHLSDLNAKVSIGALQSATWVIPATALYDNIFGGSVADSISGGPGNDTIIGYGGNDSIMGDLGNDSLQGGEGDDHLIGGAGDDVLAGQRGNDLIDGGFGNDVAVFTSGERWQYKVAANQDGTYTVTGVDSNAVEDKSDTLVGVEYVRFNDGVFAITSLVPNTIFGTSGKDHLYGSGRNEVFYGGSGNDVILANGGSDRIFGSLGNDTLTGGKHPDYFVFDTKPSKSNVDKITDFSVRDDTIWLDNKVFTKLGSKGTVHDPAKLAKDYFTIGSRAKDKNDYVIYDNKKGVLYYDADGSGKGKAVEVATLSKNLKMTYADFFVV